MGDLEDQLVKGLPKEAKPIEITSGVPSTWFYVKTKEGTEIYAPIYTADYSGRTIVAYCLERKINLAA